MQDICRFYDKIGRIFFMTIETDAKWFLNYFLKLENKYKTKALKIEFI